MRNQPEFPSHLVLDQFFLSPAFCKLSHSLHLHTLPLHLVEVLLDHPGQNQFCFLWVHSAPKLLCYLKKNFF